MSQFSFQPQNESNQSLITETHYEDIGQACGSDTLPWYAYEIIWQGLEFASRISRTQTAREVEKTHINPLALYYGICGFAKDQFGLLAMAVLEMNKLYDNVAIVEGIEDMLLVGILKLGPKDDLDEIINSRPLGEILDKDTMDVFSDNFRWPL